MSTLAAYPVCLVFAAGVHDQESGQGKNNFVDINHMTSILMSKIY